MREQHRSFLSIRVEWLRAQQCKPLDARAVSAWLGAQEESPWRMALQESMRAYEAETSEAELSAAHCIEWLAQLEGRHAAHHVVHGAITALAAGDTHGLRQAQDRWELTDGEGRIVGRFSRAYSPPTRGQRAGISSRRLVRTLGGSAPFFRWCRLDGLVQQVLMHDC